MIWFLFIFLIESFLNLSSNFLISDSLLKYLLLIKLVPNSNEIAIINMPYIHLIYCIFSSIIFLPLVNAKSTIKKVNKEVVKTIKNKRAVSKSFIKANPETPPIINEITAFFGA